MVLTELRSHQTTLPSLPPLIYTKSMPEKCLLTFSFQETHEATGRNSNGPCGLVERGEHGDVMRVNT